MAGQQIMKLRLIIISIIHSIAAYLLVPILGLSRCFVYAHTLGIKEKSKKDTIQTL